MMRIHHFSCGTLCPLVSSRLACHCLILETGSDGLVLVDTGLGMFETYCMEARVPAFFRGLCRPRISREHTALAEVKRLGYSPTDVRHIVLTHLDFDHAGGIDDFREATVHLLAAEKRAAERRMGMIARGRYRPIQFREHKRWELYEPRGDAWFGFQAVRQLRGLPPEVLLIPLIGHTPGHAGVAVRSGSGWLLHAGDAYFDHGEMDPDHPRCSPGLRGYQLMMDSDRGWRRRNQARLRGLVREHGHEIQVFSAHDWGEFERLRDSSAAARAA